MVTLVGMLEEQVMYMNDSRSEAKEPLKRQRTHSKLQRTRQSMSSSCSTMHAEASIQNSRTFKSLQA
ncbi:LOW QUALITY PROTEIN: hypothetical protein HJC23_007852 [Cyclotella cryptica]|uniref:Uncharacterized protein n=1 Tax=Cyclotella cryptica TaxID=29204 RepID=A0ABD3R2K7_9STRA